jgi:hypothetical protein
VLCRAGELAQQPLRGGGEQDQAAGGGGHGQPAMVAAAEIGQGKQAGRAPYPVVRPGHRRYKQSGEGVEDQREAVLRDREGPPHTAARHHHDDGRQRQPGGHPGRGVRVEPGAGQDRHDGLVGRCGRAADPAGLEDVRAPVARRVAPGRREPGGGGGGEGKPGHGGGPVVAPEQEEQHERRGRQLHRGGHAGQHAARPAWFNGQAVQGHQGHQHDVDLAVGQLAAQRLEQQRRRQQPGHSP